MIVLSAETDFYLRLLIMIATALLIPTIILLLFLGFKLIFFLQSVQELVATAKYEVIPILKDLRQVSETLEKVAQGASGQLKRLENMARIIGPRFNQVSENLQGVLYTLLDKASGLFGKVSSSSAGRVSQFSATASVGDVSNDSA